MTIRMCEGDVIPADGRLVIDLKDARMYRDSDGALIVDCGDCNMIAQPSGVNVNASEDWAVDNAGILVRRVTA